MNKEEIQRMKLSDLYFKHLDATWEEINNKAFPIKTNNQKEYLQAYK